jgi:hypothetical protein
VADCGFVSYLGHDLLAARESPSETVSASGDRQKDRERVCDQSIAHFILDSYALVGRDFVGGECDFVWYGDFPIN